MHISEFGIKNIRGIKSLRVKFDRPAGWHVFIGDNGSGKSTLLRSLSLSLIGLMQSSALRINYDEWLSAEAKSGAVWSELILHPEDKHSGKGKRRQTPFYAAIDFTLLDKPNGIRVKASAKEDELPHRHNWGDGDGWFSTAFGPFRRFTGGSTEWQKVFYSHPRAAAHLSVFGEDVALTESVEWLQELKYKALEKNEVAAQTLDYFKRFVNESGLLSHGTTIEEVNSDGVFLRDGAQRRIPLVEMSDGFRSILSLAFELLRQMIVTFGVEHVFAPLNNGNYQIDIHGVVLIDEVDVHLHPTWQIRIGEWFTSKFPNIQFIVTTHSPLICRAAENGSIWRLSAPGSDAKNERIQGNEFNRLVYGNVLDAYGTELFGENTTSSDHATALLEEYARLNKKAILGKINDTERQRLFAIKDILPTEAVAK